MGVNGGSVGFTWLLMMVFISGHFQGDTFEVLTENIYFHASSTNDDVTLTVLSAVINGKEHQWLWTSHDGRHSNTLIAKITSANKRLSWEIQAPFSKEIGYSLSMKPYLENAGEFVLMQTKPAHIILARFEVFGLEFKGKPIHNGKMYLGSDVSVSCEMSRLPQGASLQLEIEGGSTSNSTLYLNNTVHMVLQSVDQNSIGVFKCNIRLNENHTLTISSKLNVSASTYYNPVVTLFRGSSNNSKVNMMCRSEPQESCKKAVWIMSAKDTLSGSRESMEMVGRDRFSIPIFNGSYFPLQISPVAFEDGGEYKCNLDSYLFATFVLTTIHVSASKPSAGGHLMVLRCELSEVSGDPVTLAWLSMDGSRGLLVKREVLTKDHPNRTLSLTLPSLRSAQQRWQCVAFTQGMLRASVPLILPGSTGPSRLTEAIPSTSNVIVIGSCCASSVVAGVLVVVLGFYLRRKRTEPVTSRPLTQKTEPVYDYIPDPHPDHESLPGQPDADEEVHYVEFILGEPRTDPKIVKPVSNWEPDAVIYSTLKIT